MKALSRRSALAAGLASFAALGLSNAQAAPASVPVIWDGKKMFESFEKEATGISSQGPAGRPKAYLAFDTQCRDCWQLHRKLEPFMDKIEFVFCPISFMNIHSEPQATTILIDKDPLATTKSGPTPSCIAERAAAPFLMVCLKIPRVNFSPLTSD